MQISRPTARVPTQSLLGSCVSDCICHVDGGGEMKSDG